MIENFMKTYELWIHFSAALIILLIAVYVAYYYCVNTIVNAADNSKYAFMIIRWILDKRHEKMTPDMEKKFISKKDMDVINNMQNFLNTVKTVGLRDCKYKELKHPFFVWHDVIFCRTNGNDVVKISDGQLGKIPENEEVKEIVISENFTKIMCAIDFTVKMEQHFKDI